MNNIQFGLDLSLFTASEAVRIGILAERLGYDSVWVADHLIDLEGARVDPWVVLGGTGSQTSRITLGSCVTDVQRTHPAKLAQITSTLDELTGGRAVLGLGSGELMNILPFGLEWRDPPSRISMLEEAITVIKLLWGSDRNHAVRFSGRYFRLDNAWLDQRHVSRPFPRVYIGALSSSKLLRLTGALADGWLGYFNTPDLYKQRICEIQLGADSVGRKLDEIDTVVFLGAIFTSDKKALAEAVRGLKMWLVSERNTMRRLGIEVPIPKDHMYIHCIPNRDTIDEASKAAEGVSDEFAKQFMIYGDDVGQAIELIDKFRKAGARHFQLSMSAEHPEQMMREFADKVVSAYR